MRGQYRFKRFTSILHNFLLLTLCVMLLIRCVPAYPHSHANALPVAQKQHKRSWPVMASNVQYEAPFLDILSDAVIELMIRCDYEPTLRECRKLCKEQNEVIKPKLITICPTITETAKASVGKIQSKHGATSTVMPKISTTTTTTRTASPTTTKTPDISKIDFNGILLKTNADSTTESKIEDYLPPNPYTLEGVEALDDDEYYMDKQLSKKVAYANARNAEDYYDQNQRNLLNNK